MIKEYQHTDINLPRVGLSYPWRSRFFCIGFLILSIMGYIMDCSMRTYIGNIAYCGYYDAGYMTCSENKNCPEEDQEDEDFECDELEWY